MDDEKLVVFEKDVSSTLVQQKGSAHVIADLMFDLNVAVAEGREDGRIIRWPNHGWLENDLN